jgi:hypothetical protein
VLVAIAGGGGSLSVGGCLCALVVVVGRVVAWWVPTAVDWYGVGHLWVVLAMFECVGMGSRCGQSWHVSRGWLWAVVALRRGVV